MRGDAHITPPLRHPLEPPSEIGNGYSKIALQLARRDPLLRNEAQEVRPHDPRDQPWNPLLPCVSWLKRRAMRYLVLELIVEFDSESDQRKRQQCMQRKRSLCFAGFHISSLGLSSLSSPRFNLPPDMRKSVASQIQFQHGIVNA